MSNANKTARTTFVGVRIPNDLLAVVDASGASRTQAVVLALRAYYVPADNPEPVDDKRTDKAA